MKKLTQKQAFAKGILKLYIDPIKLGPWTSYSLLDDPIHLSFVLSRYKFVARMLNGKKLVLEVGCGDAFGTPLVAQFVKKLIAVDTESRIIDSDKQRLANIKNLEFRSMNFCEEIPIEKFDAVFAIDVIEHLDKPLNKDFMDHICKCLIVDGVCIIGTPNITSNKYAAPQSQIQHINLQSHTSLRNRLSACFKNVFMFSMNDEVVHTGFAPMAHYLFGMGVGVRK